MRRAILLLGFLLAFAPLERSFGEEITLAHRAAAALTLQREGRYDLAGQLVQCQPEQKVGLWVESRSITIANAVIENCELGIVILANKAATGADSTTEAAVHVTGAKVQGTIVGIFLAGSGGTVSHNVVTGARYGIVVTGDDYTLIGNQSNENIADGFLITGDRNLLEGNEAMRNKGAGIRIAPMVPMVQNRRFLSFIQDRGLGNIIRGNTALNNKIDLVEFADCAPAPNPPLGNQWSENIFKTRDPECIE